jgi:hypothetical protein
MQLLRNLELRERAKAEDVIHDVPQQELVAWYNHPATKALRSKLKADLFGMILDWQNGAGADDNCESVALRNAALVARSQTAQQILEAIEEMKEIVNEDGSEAAWPQDNS